MNMKKLAVDAAILKAITDVLEMPSGGRRRSKKRKGQRIDVRVGKTVEGLTESAAKTMEGLGTTVGRTVGGVSETVGKTVGGLSDSVGKTVSGVGQAVEKKVEGLGEAVEKTVESTVEKTTEMTVGRVNEMRAARRQAKIAKRRRKVRQARMNTIGQIIGFGLMFGGLYWWKNRHNQSMREMLDQANHTIRRAVDTASRTVQEVTGSPMGEQATQALRSAKDVVTRTAQDVGSKAGEQANRLSQEARTRLGADRGLESEGNGNGRAGRMETEPSESVSTDLGLGRSVDEPASRVGALAPATGPAISNGMKVVGFDGVDIGRVQEVEEDSFILDRPKGSDLRVPKDAAARVEGTVVYLRISADRVVQQGWESVGNS